MRILPSSSRLRFWADGIKKHQIVDASGAVASFGISLVVCGCDRSSTDAKRPRLTQSGRGTLPSLLAPKSKENGQMSFWPHEIWLGILVLLGGFEQKTATPTCNAQLA